MVTHVLFDFFGTLVTYAPNGPDHDFGRSHRLLRSMGSPLGYREYLAQWDAVSSRLDQEADRTGREFAMRELSAAFLRQVLDREPAAEEADALARAYLADWDTCVSYVPGLPQMLTGLSGRYRLAIVSNTNDTGLVPAHLDAMGVRHHFDTVILSVQTGWRKPHPQIYAAALDELGIGPSQAVFVGDSYRPDYHGPTQAGIRSFLIDPARATEAPDHARLESILDLTDTLTAIEHARQK
jgi:putative hydrolase of the HAD superfamily